MLEKWLNFANFRRYFFFSHYLPDVPSWTRKRSDPNRIGNTDVSLGKLGSIRRQVLEHKIRVQSSLLVSEEFPKQTFVRKNFMEQHHPKSESIRTCRCRWCNREDCFRATWKTEVLEKFEMWANFFWKHHSIPKDREKKVVSRWLCKILEKSDRNEKDNRSLVDDVGHSVKIIKMFSWKPDLEALCVF